MIGTGGAQPRATHHAVLAHHSVGERTRQHRERAGMSRPVLAGLVGKSAEWVKAVENGRLLTPRLPMLIRIAELLQVPDLADLTGEQRLSAASYAKAGHESLPAVAAALADYGIGRTVTGNAATPLTVEALEAEVRQAWTLWHGTRRHRTAVASVLPGLIRSARSAARELDGPPRRRAAAALAQVYHLTQLYLSFQSVPGLVLLTGDRAMTSAQDADDPGRWRQAPGISITSTATQANSTLPA